MESERPDALFHDPYARQLAGPQGEGGANPGGVTSLATDLAAQPCAPKMAWLWRMLARFASQKRREEFKRFSGVVLLNRKP